MQNSQEAMGKVSEAMKIASDIRDAIKAKDTEFSQVIETVSNKLEFVDATFNRSVNIESVPGARTPKWYTLDIEFEGGDTQAKSRAFEISSEGAFVLSTMQAYFKYTSDTLDDYLYGSLNPLFVGTPQGRYVPVSTFPIFGDGVLQNAVFSAASSPGEVTVGNLHEQSMYDFPEFSFNFELESTALQWADKAIPGGFYLYREQSALFQWRLLRR